MARDADEQLKRALLADIDADSRRRQQLRNRLNEIEPRLAQAQKFFRMRFGDDALSLENPAVAPAMNASGPSVEHGRVSHAQNAALALTQAQQVNKALTVEQIHQCLIAAGLGEEERPSRATLASAIPRSTLFRKVRRGQYALKEAYADGDANTMQTEPLSGESMMPQ